VPSGVSLLTPELHPVAAADASSSSGRVPGETGIWVLVFGDLTVFALFFCTFTFYRSVEPELFRKSQLALSQPLGVLNTVLLLSSSWFVVMAVHTLREGLSRRSRSLLAGALACGVGFAVVKYFEYAATLRQGFTPASNDFFMFYFVLTGIHLLHVVIGLGVLSWMLVRTRRPANGAGGLAAFECGAIYWHMVDLLWVVLFALLYLMH
jgi:nitric oxide reductase NorE protein